MYMNISQLVHRCRTWRKKPLIVIGGSTASGKTSCAIALAQGFEKKGKKAEIISADSRQIYKGIPLFSGAVTESEMENITHHLVGTEDPTLARSADWFRHETLQLIEQIHNRRNIPIIAGGSAFWIQSILFKDDYPQVETNETLREDLSRCSIPELQARLQVLDPKRFAQVDIENPRRLIRSIEIATALGSVPRMKFTPNNLWKATVIYFDLDKSILTDKIHANVENRYNQGLIEEAKHMRTLLTEKRFAELGLAYKYMDAFWRGELTEKELRKKTAIEEVRYAKRQKTFFKKMLTKLVCQVYVVRDFAMREKIINTTLEDYM